MNLNQFIVIPANETHVGYAEEICEEMAQSAKARGTGIAKRNPEYIATKMIEGKAVIALRTILIYSIIIIAMRLMGKKQLGELQPSELVSTILISNLALT